MRGMEGDEDIEQEEDQIEFMAQIENNAEQYSDDEFENPMDDPIVNNIKRLSRNLDESIKNSQSKYKYKVIQSSLGSNIDEDDSNPSIAKSSMQGSIRKLEI